MSLSVSLFSSAEKGHYFIFVNTVLQVLLNSIGKSLSVSSSVRHSKYFAKLAVTQKECTLAVPVAL